MTRAKIIGVGAYAPKRVLTNADLEKMIDTNDEWIVQRTGIRERRIVDENEATSDLAIKAAQQAIERANLVPEDIEFIVVGTTTPDMFFPSVGNIVQHRIVFTTESVKPQLSRIAPMAGFARLFSALANFAKNKTVIMVTHREAGLGLVDVIYGMEQGVLSELQFH